MLFDPLSYEANKYDKLKAFLRDVIAQNETVKPSTKFCGSCIEDNNEKIKPKPTTSKVPHKIARNNEAPVKTPNKASDLFKLFENAVEKIKLKSPLRQGSNGDVPRNKEPGAEYDFNGAKCRIVNNRLLCGYDKNKGELKTDEFVDLGNGCRQFNDRVECGYESPPFTGNIRRPPPRDSQNLRSSHDDDLQNIARTVLKAISEQESKMGNSTNDLKATSPSITESVSSNSNSTAAIVIATNSTITVVTASNSTLSTTAEFLMTSTTRSATESSAYLTTETSQNITSSSSIIPKSVTVSILEYLLKYFSPTQMLNETSSTTTLAPSTHKVISDLLLSETPVESSTSSESGEFLTNDILVDVVDNFSVSASSISEVTGTSSHPQTNVSLTSSRLPKKVRRSADKTLFASEETTVKPEAVREGNKPSRWCVEKGDRIVCYYANNRFVLD